MNNIIGLAGGMCSGKDSWANLFASEFGYTHCSTSQTTREYINKYNLGEPTRDLTRETSTLLRMRFGKDFFVRKILDEIDENTSKLVISGFYVPEEVQALKRSGGFLVSVFTDSEIRFNRMNLRKREGESGQLDLFNRLDVNDMLSEDTDQKLQYVIQEADFQIDGNIPIADKGRCIPIAKEIIKRAG